MKKMFITFISDTHNKHTELVMPNLQIDNNTTNIIIHSGDFSHNQKQFDDFMLWYSELPGYDHRILIPGNHELIVEKDPDMFFRTCKELNINGLIDNEVVIDDIKFYGSPWTPTFGNWAYMRDDYLLDVYWDKIPKDTNVLITHGPAYSILDGVIHYGYGEYVGSTTLADAIDGLKDLQIHTFGHIHEAKGMYKENKILRINASSVNSQYNIIPPVIIDYNNNKID
jgi:Icc-related predicted phosphoesterase